MTFTEIASPSIRQALEAATDSKGFLGFNDFTRIALYHPEFGYYRAERPRVGRDAHSDFFTASSLKNAFAPILIEASQTLLQAAGLEPSEVSWVELGAEQGKALLDDFETPFRDARAIRVGESIELKGSLVVFSNELFDAQPFHSVIFRKGRWSERGVQIDDQGLRLTERSDLSPEVETILTALPSAAPEGYTVDLPIAATKLIETIAGQDWNGLFIAFDYGKTWQALCYDTPQGTARAYRNHAQVPNLLQDIGEQDLTCHVCWDWLEAALAQSGLQQIELESQESFILKRAPELVAQAFQGSSGLDNELKGQLRQLIHPALMGQKFQTLTALKP